MVFFVLLLKIFWTYGRLFFVFYKSKKTELANYYFSIVFNQVRILILSRLDVNNAPYASKASKLSDILCS